MIPVTNKMDDMMKMLLNDKTRSMVTVVEGKKMEVEDLSNGMLNLELAMANNTTYPTREFYEIAYEDFEDEEVKERMINESFEETKAAAIERRARRLKAIETKYNVIFK